MPARLLCCRCLPPACLARAPGVAPGLWDPHGDVHMGHCAEMCAETYAISRAAMDDHAEEAFARATAAAPYARWEVVPVRLPPGKGQPEGRLAQEDEALGKINTAKLRGLKPYFKQARARLRGARCARVCAFAGWRGERQAS